MANGKQDAPAAGRRCEIRALQTRTSKKGDVETIAKDEYKPVDFDPEVEYALVVNQKFKADGKLEGTELTINSPHLLSTLKEVFGEYHVHPSTFELPTQMESPFIDLYHYWEQLEAYRDSTEDDTTRMHLGLLLTFMRGEMLSEKTQVLDMINSGSITFFKLWTLYRPGDVVYAEEKGHPCILKLEKVAYEESQKTGRRFEVHCTHTIQDGQRLCQYRKTTNIFEKASFAGDTPCNIAKLPIYPLSFVTGGPMTTELEQRGERCEKLTGILNMYYDGPAEYQRAPPKSFFDPWMDEFDLLWLPFTESARVVIDAKTFPEEYGKAKEPLIARTTDEYRNWAVSRYGSLERANRILCAPWVWGFSLSKKQWCKFYVPNLKPIEWDESMMQALILPEKRKELMRALVTSHETPSVSAREESQHKGKGLVILLHGTPGSGKTLSAEASAEVSHAALMKISLGEMYQNGYFDEDVLKYLFQYATIWKAIVLIDEADVFLEARSSGTGESAQRNGLVATFLRYLEYFSGIVFLTSNRVEDFDQAMKSRIHLALQFLPPPNDTRRRIWRQQLLSISVEERDTELDDQEMERWLDHLVKEDMNGREIANSVGTARTLARFNKQKLSLEHLETVVDSWRDFSNSLAKLEIERQTKPRQDTMVSSPSKAREDSVVISSADGLQGSRWLP